MPKNQVSSPITDQEIAFARLVLSGTMTDRRAAEAVGLNPGTAAYTKSKPRVRTYMLEHRAAVREQLVQQETEGQFRLNLGREQVLARLWEIANLSPDMTRFSITGQIKALAMIVAIQGLIPDRPAANKPDPPPPARPNVYVAQWLRDRQAASAAPQPDPNLGRDEEATSVQNPPPNVAADVPSNLDPDPGPAADTGESLSVDPVITSEAISSAPPTTPFASALHTGVPFSIKRNPFARRRLGKL